jgi:hypothetical protein
MQGTIRKKEEELTGAIWDCLPVTENYLSPETRTLVLPGPLRPRFLQKAFYDLAKTEMKEKVLDLLT